MFTPIPRIIAEAMMEQKNKSPNRRNPSLHASGEDYLEAVLVLQRKKGMVRSVDVARHMGVSKPSVCHAVSTLKEGGFLTMDGDFFLRLTDVGREVAEQTYEKHCFFTRLLVEAGVDPKTAEQDACRMEHVISPESFQKLAELYQKAHPNTDPTGDGRQFHAKTDPAD